MKNKMLKHVLSGVSTSNKNHYMLQCVVLLCSTKKKNIKNNMKNHIYYCYLRFAIHFYLSDIFPNFWRGLNFANGNFRDILRGLYFVNGKFRNISNISIIFHGKCQNPQNKISQKLIHLRYFREKLHHNCLTGS